MTHLWDPVKIQIRSVNSKQEVKPCISNEFAGDPDALKPGVQGTGVER